LNNELVLKNKMQDQLYKILMNLLVYIPIHDKYYFWRDKNQKEIDLIRENGTQLIPIEIKSSETFHASFANQIKYWMNLANVEEAQVIYGGQNLKQFFPGIQVMHWKDIV
jgi:predicted AAA+ superfamily ATPase